MQRVPDSRALAWVFLDSGAYLALLDRDDAHHAQALLILQRLAAQRRRLFTTNAVIIESHALIMSSLGISVAAEFLRGMERSSTTLVRVRAADEQAAKEVIYRYRDKDFSFTDAISFSVMIRLGIADAFTFDRHFSQFGLTQLA